MVDIPCSPAPGDGTLVGDSWGTVPKDSEQSSRFSEEATGFGISFARAWPSVGNNWLEVPVVARELLNWGNQLMLTFPSEITEYYQGALWSLQHQPGGFVANSVSNNQYLVTS